MPRKPGRGTGNRNSASLWGTGGTSANVNTWNPSNDFLPAWIPLNQLKETSELFFDTELPAGELQRYLPLYINNDGVADSTDTFILELDPRDSSIGFSHETYILQERWDQVAGDIPAFGVSGIFEPFFGSPFPDESSLNKMYLANGNSKPLNTPKIVVGGKFRQATIIIEDAQSSTPPVRLDSNNNSYIVTDTAGGPSTDAVYAGAGNDQVIGSNSSRKQIQNFRSTNGKQSIQIENPLADHLFGEAGNDALRGGLGEDLLNGGSGNDLLLGEGGEDILYGMMGDDVLWGDYEENYKSGNNLNGDGTRFVRHRDILNGGSGNDALFGGAGADLLYGGDGIDYLNPGKKGTNTAAHPQWLEGGSGADRFDFYTDPWLPADEVQDFTKRELSSIAMTFLKDFDAVQGDKIGVYVGTNYASDFSNSGLPINAAINPNQFHIGEKAATERHRFIYKPFDSSTLAEGGKLYFDRDGSGLSPQVLLAFLENSPTLTQKDIVTFDDSKRLPPPSSSVSSPNNSKNETLEASAGQVGIPQLETQKEIQSPSSNSSNGVKNSHIIGSDSNDRLFGTVGDDKILGGKGNDVLNGGLGKDILYGGLGSDKLIGGKQRDIFVLEKGKGRDQIIDFKDKQDRMGLIPGVKFKQLEITSQGRNTLISLGEDQLAVLKGVSRGLIDRLDFISVDPLRTWGEIS